MIIHKLILTTLGLEVGVGVKPKKACQVGNEASKFSSPQFIYIYLAKHHKYPMSN